MGVAEILKAEIAELEKELEKKQKSNRDAWEMYGSELCAGGMIKEEQFILSKIRRQKKLLEVLDTYGNKKGLDVLIKRTISKITTRERKIKTFIAEIKNLEEDLGLAEELLELFS